MVGKKIMHVAKSVLTGFHSRESVEEWPPPEGSIKKYLFCPSLGRNGKLKKGATLLKSNQITLQG